MAVAINDTYHWRVEYQDGTYVDEFDESRPDGRGPAETLDKPVASITLLPADGKPAHALVMPADATPVFFWRQRLVINPNDETSGTLRIHCIGWEQDGRGVYLFVFNDGSCLLSADKQAV